MDFALTEDQATLQQTVLRVARAHLGTDLVRRDREGEFDVAGWRTCAELGLTGLCAPTQYGGGGLDAVTTALALESLGTGCRDNGLAFSINAHLWTVVMPLVEFGTDEQKARYLPRLCSGELIGANAMSEPDAGSDAYSLATTAELRGDRYVLNGSKVFVSNAPVAGVMLVFASTDRQAGAKGVSAFLVSPSSRGVELSPPSEKMGLRTSPMAQVFLGDVEVPVAERLGREGAGAALFAYSMSWERACILATAIGSMQRLLDTSINYARQRRQFGKPIGKHQLVATKIVDMKLRLETARQLLYHTAWQRDRGRSIHLEAAMTKLYLSECWVRCAEDALQIHGGYGYMQEQEIERELRDALSSRIYSGTSEIQRNIIASLLGL